MAIEKTYSMIKPDGVRNGHIGEIVNRFERAGLKVERLEMGMVTSEQAAANYAEHEGKPFYDGLISYITSGPVVKMVYSVAPRFYRIIVCFSAVGVSSTFRQPITTFVKAVSLVQTGISSSCVR